MLLGWAEPLGVTQKCLPGQSRDTFTGKCKCPAGQVIIAGRCQKIVSPSPSPSEEQFTDPAFVPPPSPFQEAKPIQEGKSFQEATAPILTPPAADSTESARGLRPPPSETPSLAPEVAPAPAPADSSKKSSAAPVVIGVLLFIGVVALVGR